MSGREAIYLGLLTFNTIVILLNMLKHVSLTFYRWKIQSSQKSGDFQSIRNLNRVVFSYCFKSSNIRWTSKSLLVFLSYMYL